MIRRLHIRSWLVALLVLSLALLITRIIKYPNPSLLTHYNQLAIGNLSNFSGPVQLTINPVVELDLGVK